MIMVTKSVYNVPGLVPNVLTPLCVYNVIGVTCSTTKPATKTVLLGVILMARHRLAKYVLTTA